MKRLIGIILIISILLTSCAREKKIIFTNEDGTKTEKIVTPFGLINEYDQRNNDVAYKINVGNIIWSVIAIETIIVPVILIGWQLYEPIGLRY
jgi:hypothetical protein